MQDPNVSDVVGKTIKGEVDALTRRGVGAGRDTFFQQPLTDSLLQQVRGFVGGTKVNRDLDRSPLVAATQGVESSRQPICRLVNEQDDGDFVSGDVRDGRLTTFMRPCPVRRIDTHRWDDGNRPVREPLRSAWSIAEVRPTTLVGLGLRRVLLVTHLVDHLFVDVMELGVHVICT